ncbi:MAG: OmpH family outer membrane protein [bacterium]|nr:OmpH family outer membrane protein [bacterium]
MKVAFKEHLFLTVALSALLGFSCLTFAQDTTASLAPLKIGVVDVLKVYNAWEVQKKADAQFQPMRDKLQEKDKNITAMKEELRRQQSVLKQEQIAQREAAIKKEERDLRDQVEELSGKIEDRAKELTKELDNNLREIYATLAEKEGYTLILEKRAVRYSKPGLDLTDQITEMLNKKGTAPEPVKLTPAKSESAPPPSAPKKVK